VECTGLVAVDRVLTLQNFALAPRCVAFSRASKRSMAASSSTLNRYTIGLHKLSFELLPVPRTLGLGVMMGLEVADGTTQFQPGVQARGAKMSFARINR
jgi:hypothetical protein